MKPIDIRILMAIAAGIIVVVAIQNLENNYMKIAVIIFGLYLAYKSRFF